YTSVQFVTGKIGSARLLSLDFLLCGYVSEEFDRAFNPANIDSRRDSQKLHRTECRFPFDAGIDCRPYCGNHVLAETETIKMNAPGPYLGCAPEAEINRHKLIVLYSVN